MRGNAARRLALVAALFLLSAATRAVQAASYPPHLRFQTISTEQVSVHFHQGLERRAREAATLATELLSDYEARYEQNVGRVHVVIVDAADDPNGFATPVPFPLVTIRAVAPDGSDGFGNHEDWLRLALTHELAHTVHLEEAHGLWRAARTILGRAPYLFPNAYSMSWLIEGLATYEETERTAFGRGRDPDSQMVLRMAALDDRFPSEDQAIYALDSWPGGQAPYLFGEAFVRWLTERGGDDTLPRWARQHSTQIIPFLDGRTSRKVTGDGLHTQWKAWEEEATAAFERQAETRQTEGLTESRALTDRGIQQMSPRFSPDGAWVAYSSRTLSRFPAIRIARADGSEDRRLVLRNGGSGLAWTPDGQEIVFAEAQVYRTFSIFNDLSAVNVETGRVRRITRGARAYDPDISPDGRAIVFARKMGDRSELFTTRIEGGNLLPLTTSPPGVEWSGPRWSPRGDAIVASRLLPGGWLDVVHVDPATGETRNLTHDRAKDVEPTWLPDGKALVFRSDRDGVSNLYGLRLPDGVPIRLTNVLGGAFQPSVSPDGRTVAFADYSGRGFDVRAAPLDLPEGRPAPPFIDPHPAPRPKPRPAAEPVRPYRPWTMLWPRFWTPWIQLGDPQSRFGVATGGSDALFRHVWGLRALYGTETRRVDTSVFYVYDRFRPTLLLTAEDTLDPTTEGDQRTRNVSARLSFPLRRTIRSAQTLAVAYRRERTEIVGGEPESRLDVGGIETSWSLNTARSYPWSISPIDGGRLRLAWLREAEGLGSDLSLDKLTADGRAYMRLFGERDVLALRAQGGTTRGEPEFERSFAVGGYPNSNIFDLVRSNLAVLRGYPDDAFTGRRFVAANAEYRFPLVSPQRGWRSLPLFLRHLRGTVFFDAANAWSGDFRIADMKTAAGASLGFDTAVGFAVPFTAELTVARGFDDLGDTKLYFRLGLAF
ncbi:MAG: BamA/TamA family outer membrane protein [Acidobacteriota bacterium]|jgi:Tol biopolymer transport system component